MHDGGARLETTLATMFSSPTLNVIVLSMLFALFPPYLIAVKLSLTLLFILFLVPLLSRFVFSRERAPTYDDAVCAVQPSVPAPPNESWPGAARTVASILLRNIGYIVVRTVPLMLLAGLLGAVVVHLVPISSLLEHEPTIFSVGAVALIGIFLPVPIAFDLVLVAVLVSAGAPMIYSMTLLFTLGIFSVYPFFIVWNSISPRVAVVVTAVLVLLGIVGGFIADEIHQADIRDMLEYLNQEL